MKNSWSLVRYIIKVKSLKDGIYSSDKEGFGEDSSNIL
jgi:hypothetical protein